MIRTFCIATLMICGMAAGQSTTQPTATPQPAATNAKQITFEVASIRRNKTGIMGGSGPTDDGYSVRNYAPVLLIGMAYGVLEFQRIQGLPAWCNWRVEGYDIDAKVAESDIAEWKKEVSKQFPAALQVLLEDRFKLKAHFEMRPRMRSWSQRTAQSSRRQRRTRPTQTASMIEPESPYSGFAISTIQAPITAS